MQQRPDATRPITSAVTNAVVRVTREFTGRGPTQARAVVDDESATVTVIMQGLLSRTERHLLEQGRTGDVEAMRRTVQDAMAGALADAVEELVGRRVRAVLSTNHEDPDYTVVIFVLDD